MTKVEELKKMYENMGGDPEAVADKTLITEMLDAMSELELSGLPDVTADDNGEILTVVDGEWNKAAAPTELPAVTAEDNGEILTVVNGEWNKAVQAGAVVVFNATMTTAGGITTGTLSDGKTFSDIYAAYQSGKFIMLRVTGTLASQAIVLILKLDKVLNNGSTDALYFDVVTLDHNSNVVIYKALLNMSSTTGTTFQIQYSNITTT